MLFVPTRKQWKQAGYSEKEMSEISRDYPILNHVKEKDTKLSSYKRLSTRK